jgi:hypothetical protein
MLEEEKSVNNIGSQNGSVVQKPVSLNLGLKPGFKA